MAITYSNYSPQQVKAYLGPALAAAITSVANNYKLDPRRNRNYGVMLWSAAAGPLVDYLYAKASGSAPDLQTVTTAGNITSNDIIAENLKANVDLQSKYNLYLNVAGAATWARIYWYDSDKSPAATGAWLGYNSVDNAFTFSDVVRVPHPSGSFDAANKSYVDTRIETIDTLQEITDNGNTTTNPLIVYGSGSIFNALNITGPITVDGIADFRLNNIINVTDPVFAQDVATKNYVDLISGSIGSDLHSYDYATNLYVNTISGSIGNDLNYQILTLYNYVNTISGSIGNDLNYQILTLYDYVNTISGSIGNDLNYQILTLYDYVDLISGSIGGTQTLDDVCENGNITDKDIKIINATNIARLMVGNTASGSSAIYLDAQNGDFSGGDYARISQLNSGELTVQLESSSPSWAIQFRDSTVELVGIYRAGPYLRSQGDISADSNIYINYDGADGDSYLYFYDGSSSTGQYLKWDDDPGQFVLSTQLSMSTHKIVDVVDPTSNQDVATKNYVDLISGSIGSDLNYQILTLYDYVNTISGSIGNDLNYQILTLYDYVDAEVFNTPTLQSVTDNGNTTTNEIIAATLSSNGNIFINKDGGEGDSYLYFYDGILPTGRHLKWNESGGRFETNATLYVTGDIFASSNIVSYGNIYVNYNGGEGDSYLYFYENGSPTGAHIQWDDSADSFAFSDGIDINGTVKVLSTDTSWTTPNWGRAIELENADVLKWKLAGTHCFGIGQTSNTLFFIRSTADDTSAAADYVFLITDTDVQCRDNLNMYTANKIINLADPTDNQDAATKKYVDDTIASASISSGSSPTVIALYPNVRLINNWGWNSTDDYIQSVTIVTGGQEAFVYLSMPNNANTITITGELHLASSDAAVLIGEVYLERKITTGSWTSLGTDSDTISHVLGGGDTTINFAWVPSFSLNWVDGAQYRLKIVRTLSTTIGVSVCNLKIYGVSIS